MVNKANNILVNNSNNMVKNAFRKENSEKIITYYRIETPENIENDKTPIKLVKTNTDILIHDQKPNNILKSFKSKSNIDTFKKQANGDERIPAMSKGSRRLIGCNLLPKRTKTNTKLSPMNSYIARQNKFRNLNSDFEDEDEEYVLMYDSTVEQSSIPSLQNNNQILSNQNQENYLKNNIQQINSPQTTSSASTSEASAYLNQNNVYTK